jgi:ATP-dependent Lon protease
LNFFGKSDEKLQRETLQELRQVVVTAGLPAHVQQIAEKEIEMLSRISQSTAEYSIGLTYIDYLISLPWMKKSEDNLDVSRAKKILDESHYGLDTIKSRILEHLAVKILMTHKRNRILVVDDEEIALKNLEHILIKEGYTVYTANSGASAIQLIEKKDFDVVITDLKMSGMDGIYVLEKSKSRYPDSQVIMITGYASVDSAIEAIKKGAFHYIEKPFKADSVRSTVKNAIAKKLSTRSTKGSVLCFSGPPGTGKTSIGRAIAAALGRKFSRISLGGIKDEAEIRGHRRTYAGAMPGRIIEEIRRAGFSNPVLMLDELDKIGQDFRGDSSSALLEVLDPEQNHHFIDHYLDVPFDLSSVMFIVTANVADNIQGPLRDRMEVIEFSGYTEDEKKAIATRFLVPKQIHAKGLSDKPPEFTESAVTKIIQEYTREAGIRELERQIATICRKIATEFVNRPEKQIHKEIAPEFVAKYLGPRRYFFELADAKNRIGVTTGLVWTETGGAIIFVEAARMKGTGKLLLTGSLGDVMRESAQAALSYIRSNASSLGIAEDFFEYQDIHIHVPAGAIPKDGPSAGATIVIALMSLLTGRLSRRDVAISGEITLSGRILPVGGIREKMLAARQAGVRVVVFPEKNRVDVKDLPLDVKQNTEIRLVDNIDEIINTALI